MPGYSPHLRITPPAGAEIDFALDAINTLTVQKWFPEAIGTIKETVRRRVRAIHYGWRLRAIFEWAIVPGSLDEANPDNEHATSGIVGLIRYVNRADHVLAVNMNGGGTPYRECVFDPSAFSRRYANEKHVLGLWHMEFICVDLLSEDSLPPEVAQFPPGLMSWHGGA